MTAYEKGLQGEHAARAFLVGKGLGFLCTRFRGAGGEIDLVMLDGQQVVFVEVKARPDSPKGHGLEAVTPAKQRKLARGAAAYLAKEGLIDHPVRFDVIEISRSGIIHIENAFLVQAWPK